MQFMNKKYTYESRRYAVRITGIGYFSFLMLLYGLYHLLFIEINMMYIALIGICLYIFYETFIICANPNEIIISDRNITFKDPRREDTYNWNEIKDWHVKELPNRRQLYIRINNEKFNFYKGRYWVYCYYFNDCEELYKFLVEKEYEIHPDSLKAKAIKKSEHINK